MFVIISPLSIFVIYHLNRSNCSLLYLILIKSIFHKNLEKFGIRLIFLILILISTKIIKLIQILILISKRKFGPLEKGLGTNFDLFLKT